MLLLDVTVREKQLCDQTLTLWKAYTKSTAGKAFKCEAAVSTQLLRQVRVIISVNEHLDHVSNCAAILTPQTFLLLL